MNSPLPPIFDSERSSTWSPRVVISSSETSHDGYSACSRGLTCSACQSASLLARVAMTSLPGVDSCFIDYLAKRSMTTLRTMPIIARMASPCSRDRPDSDLVRFEDLKSAIAYLSFLGSPAAGDQLAHG